MHALCLTIVCSVASASSPNLKLTVESRVELGPLQGVTSKVAFTAVNGLIADLNGDGAPDIVLGINGSPPAVYLNNGTSTPFQNVEGVFVSPPSGPTSVGLGWGAAVLADVNADGHPDLAIAGFNTPNMVYLNNGTANPFTGTTGIAIGTQDESYELAFGDVNGDGFVDMAVANTNHLPSRLYLTNGAPLTSGNYSTVQIGTDMGYGQDIKIADVNGDGKPDLILTYAPVATTDPSGIAIYLNNGTSSPFSNVEPMRLLVGQSVGAIAVADLNGDGKSDLVAAVSNPSLTQNDLYVFLNTGAAPDPFGSPQTLLPDGDLAGGCVGVSVGDVNGDGLPDLLFSCTSQLYVHSPVSPATGAIYLNNGTASPFANVAPVDIPTMIPESNGISESVAVGTLIKNGTPDVLIVDGGIVTGGQSGMAGYDPTRFSNAGADSVATAAQVDYQGEGKADYTVWRPSTGIWYSNDGRGVTSSSQWGVPTDLPVVGDFDGDGKTDVAVWRPALGEWYIVQSSNGAVVTKQWGESTDVPITGDFDGDGKTDIAVWRPSLGEWYIAQSSNGEMATRQFGESTDVPVSGDFDGDGKTDLAVWRPSTGTWYITQSSNGEAVTQQWGESMDVPVLGDFDGDGKTDLAVWRPSLGEWYIVQSSDGEVVTKQWGEAGDIPVARDYDGDGKTDIAVFRPSTGLWYVIQSSDGQVVTQQWGAPADVAVNSLQR